MSNMVVFQDVDKCVRCNGCVLACKRTWKMSVPGDGQVAQLKVAPSKRLSIKSQKRVDMGPFVRYTCWHCPEPPCVAGCPFKALKKEANGAVSIDPSKCNPGGTNSKGQQCKKQCSVNCNRSGYPKVGEGAEVHGIVDDEEKSWKCTLCFGRAGSNEELAAIRTAYVAETGDTSLPAGATQYGNPLPTRQDWSGDDDPRAHEPACVYTCPAKAMRWGTKAEILAYMNANGYTYRWGDGAIIWGSRVKGFAAPKADPFIEDHVSPLVSGLLHSPFAKAAIVPTVVAGGMLAVMARREKIASEASSLGEE